MRLAAIVLALAPLATTRAEVVHLLEDFSDAQRFFTDAGASLLMRRSSDSRLSLPPLLEAAAIMRIGNTGSASKQASSSWDASPAFWACYYAELYRDRRGASAEAYALIEDKKVKLYPRTFAYRCRGTDGAAPTTEELPLFGDLIDAVDSCAEINERPS